MNKWVSVSLTLLIALSFSLAGCTSKSGKSGDPSGGSTAPQKKAVKGEVVIWSFKDKIGDDAWISGFKKLFPDVTLTNVKFDDPAGAALTAIAAGQGAPDVIMAYNGDLRRFNNIAGIEDLSKPPYDAATYKKDIPDGLWQQVQSLDGKRMIAWPWDFPPMITLYRNDILEENGFESDPVKLGEFMKNPDNFFDMAQKLKAKGINVIENDGQLLGLMTTGVGFFDKDLNYLRGPKGQYADKFTKGLDLAKQSKQLKLGEGINIWIDTGHAMVNTGKLAMIHSGAWYPGILEGYAPDTKGKWRATTLPFGAYGGSGGTVLLITSQSKNKDAAWEYMKFQTISDVSLQGNIKNAYPTGYKPLWNKPEWLEAKKDFLGDQKVGVMYSSIIDKIPSLVFTDLDPDAEKIWNESIGAAIEKGNDSATTLGDIEAAIEKAVKIKKDNILRVRG